MAEIADLCAGVGGFHLAFQRLGIHASMACEIDKHAQTTYKYNFPKVPIIDDIRKMSGKDMEDADILCAGFPCQAFSIAGYQRGFDDDRGTIFHEIKRIAEESKPDVIFLENVKNLKNHDKGRTFEIILNELRRIGYNGSKLHYKVLDARDFGMYQMRERTIIVGFKEGIDSERFNLEPTHKTPEKNFHCLLEKFVEIQEKYFIKKDSHMAKEYLPKIKNPEDNRYIYQFRRRYWREYLGRCPTLTANMGTGGHNVPFIYDDRGEAPPGSTKYRKLTPNETFRMQGFGIKEFPFEIPKEVPDSKLYHQAGNAIPVPVAYEIAKRIKNVL